MSTAGGRDGSHIDLEQVVVDGTAPGSAQLMKQPVLRLENEKQYITSYIAPQRYQAITSWQSSDQVA